MIIENLLSNVSVPNDVLQASAYGICFLTGSNGAFICTENINYMDVVVGSMRERRSSVKKDGVSVTDLKEFKTNNIFKLKNIVFYKSSLGWIIGVDNPLIEEKYLIRYIEKEVSVAYPVYYNLIRCKSKDRDRDILTGCYTRSEFFSHFKSNLKTIMKSDLPLYLFYMDFNNFKTINDTLGHSTGDKVLCSIAEEIRSVFLGYGNVYRVGGDEFVGITFGVPEKKVEEIKRDIEAVTRQAPCGLFVSVSVGLKKITRQAQVFDNNDVNNLVDVYMEEVEKDMYKAKDRFRSVNGQSKYLCDMCPFRSVFDTKMSIGKEGK